MAASASVSTTTKRSDMSKTDKTPEGRVHRMGVRLTERQYEMLLERASADYRKPQQELQRLVDGAIASEYLEPVPNEFRVDEDILDHSTSK
jgi:hypothetical protein